MYSGSATGGSAGDRLLGNIDKQGLRIGSFSVRSDESLMLLSMFDQDGFTLGTWDVYAYTLTGEAIDRVTAVDKGFGGAWSPDGNHILFKYGNSAECSVPGCVATCSTHVIASNQRAVGLSATQQLDDAKMPCDWAAFWRG